MTPPTCRLDVALVDRGLARSRAQAQQLVRSGGVLVDGVPARRPAQPVSPTAALVLTATASEDSHWVGRGAHKLLAALERHPHVARAVDGGRCLDVGASTGGFTQVLLEAGAREVVALDVGHDQLAAELRSDPRVRDLPGTNARDLAPARHGRFDVVVSDVSFISLTLLLVPIRSVVLPLAHVVLLVKPQFEVGRERIGDGVVRDPRAHRDALRAVTAAATDAGFAVHGLDPSPIEGAEGNREFLLWLRPGPAEDGLTGADLGLCIDAVTVGATG